MGNLLLRVFFFPGDVVCSALGVIKPDDRMMVRTLINMLVWNLLMVLAALALFG